MSRGIALQKQIDTRPRLDLDWDDEPSIDGVPGTFLSQSERDEE